MVTTHAQIPDQGRVVRYVMAVGAAQDESATPVPVVTWPAVITVVDDPPPAPSAGSASRTARQRSETDVRVSLAVFTTEATTYPRRVPYDPAGTVPGTWHWPGPLPAGADR